MDGVIDQLGNLALSEFVWLGFGAARAEYTIETLLELVELAFRLHNVLLAPAFHLCGRCLVVHVEIFFVARLKLIPFGHPPDVSLLFLLCEPAARLEHLVGWRLVYQIAHSVVPFVVVAVYEHLVGEVVVELHRLDQEVDVLGGVVE